MRRTRRAYDTVRAFMRSLVSTTRETIRSEAEDALTKRAKDLFALLVQASEGAGSKMGLNDNELVNKTRCCLAPLTGDLSTDWQRVVRWSWQALGLVHL